MTFYVCSYGIVFIEVLDFIPFLICKECSRCECLLVVTGEKKPSLYLGRGMIYSEPFDRRQICEDIVHKNTPESTEPYIVARLR